MRRNILFRYKFSLFLFLIILSFVATIPVTEAKGANAKSGFVEDFIASSLPKKWYTASWHGTYSVGSSILNLQSADYTPWASISVQTNCKPTSNNFRLSARVRNNGGYGVYLALFVSNQTFIVSKNGEENYECTRNTIAIEDDYESFKVCRGTSPTAIHWSWFTIAGSGTVGNWYIVELEVNENPYQLVARVYDNNNVLIGSGTISDMVLPYSQINVCGIAIWRGVPASDSLANFDIDWIKGENLRIIGLPKRVR